MTNPEFQGYLLALHALHEIGVVLTEPQRQELNEVLLKISLGQLTLVQSAREVFGPDADESNPVVAELLRDDASTTNARVVTERETAKRVIQAHHDARNWQQELKDDEDS